MANPNKAKNIGFTSDEGKHLEDKDALTPVEHKTTLIHTNKTISSKTPLRAEKAKEAVYRILVSDVFLPTNTQLNANEILSKNEYIQKMEMLKIEIGKLEKERVMPEFCVWVSGGNSLITLCFFRISNPIYKFHTSNNISQSVETV